MNSRKLFALLLVLMLSGSALALQQKRLYRTFDNDNNGTDADPFAQGVIAIQQHTVFVEIIVEINVNQNQIHQFAAVVGLVKKCKQARNVFDNAVLWFNDQFLFGNKSNVTVNVTPPNAMGRNPNRTILLADLLDDNRNNGTGLYNASTGGFEINESGVGANEGGNPDRDGFIRAQDFNERWGGCFIPDGFVHAIGSDDPYSTGEVIHSATVDTCGPVGGPCPATPPASGITTNPAAAGNIGTVKTLIGLDNSCSGCLFTYVGTFYVTDPNNHRWMVDKLIYPLDVAGILGLGDDPTNCHVGPNFLTTGLPDGTPDSGIGTFPFGVFDSTLGIGGCGTAQDQHRDRAEDNGIPEGQTFDDPDPEDTSDPCLPAEDCQNENFDNHCFENDPADECVANSSDPTDEKGADDSPFQVEKFTTKEPIFTVHLQVDPWNPDRQGFPDEAIWKYRQDGRLRVGLPYSEDLTTPSGEFCHDAATLAGAAAVAPIPTSTADAYEYDYQAGEGGDAPPGNLTTAPGSGSLAWSEFRRGPVGNTVECAIEYNFLIAVDFEAFDNVNGGTVRVDEEVDVPPPPPEAGVVVVVKTQDEDGDFGHGENEIFRDAKEHGEGGADDVDKSWQGNSHPHNPREACLAAAPPFPALPADACDSGPIHNHDALSLDLFFFANAPYFVRQNPYWDHANATDAIQTTGTPPVVDDLCITAPFLPPSDYRRQAVEARIPIVCDVDAVDGFHLHDGSQTIPNP